MLAQAIAGLAPAAELLQQSRVAIIDDEPMHIDQMQRYLAEAGYSQIQSTTDALRAVDWMRSEAPDVVLLDLAMPEQDGVEILRRMRSDIQLQHTPTIVLTAATDAETKGRVLELGASDLLSKPVERSELLLRLRNTLVARAHQDQLETYSMELEEQVRQRTAELELAQQKVIHCLARAAEFRDDDTGKHVLRVGRYAAIIARQLGCHQRWVEMIGQAAQLHDVGKIGIPDGILMKRGQLDSRELKQMQEHCDIGLSIIDAQSPSDPNRPAELSGIAANPELPIMQMAASIAHTHHEKWDGSGYPQGTIGEQIPLEGRITAVADVFDALGSQRPYKPALPIDACVAVIKQGAGSHFDPEVVEAFVAAFDEIEATRRALSE